MLSNEEFLKDVARNPDKYLPREEVQGIYTDLEKSQKMQKEALKNHFDDYRDHGDSMKRIREIYAEHKYYASTGNTVNGDELLHAKREHDAAQRIASDKSFDEAKYKEDVKFIRDCFRGDYSTAFGTVINPDSLKKALPSYSEKELGNMSFSEKMSAYLKQQASKYDLSKEHKKKDKELVAALEGFERVEPNFDFSSIYRQEFVHTAHSQEDTLNYRLNHSPKERLEMSSEYYHNNLHKYVADSRYVQTHKDFDLEMMGMIEKEIPGIHTMMRIQALKDASRFDSGANTTDGVDHLAEKAKIKESGADLYAHRKAEKDRAVDFRHLRGLESPQEADLPQAPYNSKERITHDILYMKKMQSQEK